MTHIPDAVQHGILTPHHPARPAAPSTPVSTKNKSRKKQEESSQNNVTQHKTGEEKTQHNN